MVDVGVGALGYVGFGKETTEGTAVAPTHFLAVDSVSFNDSNDYLYPIQVKGSRFHNVAMPAPFIVQGTTELELPPDDIGYLLKSAWAASVSTSPYSGGGYSHVMTPGDTSDTFTFETSADGFLIMRYAGIRVNTLDVKAAFGEIVKATFGLDGVTRAKQGSASTPSYASSSVTPFHFNGVKVQIGGSDSTLVKDFALTTNNNVSHIGTLRQTRSHKRVALGVFEASGKMTLDFQDSAEYDRLLNDTEFAVQLYMEGPDLTGNSGKKTSLTIDLPRCKYKMVGLPINAGDFLSQDCDLTVIKPNSGAIATVTLVCNDASLA